MKISFTTLLFCSAACLATAASAADWTMYGHEYESQTAQQKHDQLWEKITADTEHKPYYSTLEQMKVLVETYDHTLHFKGDTFENGMFGPNEKFIHTVGATRKIKFVPNKNSEGWTGLLKEGGDYGIIRLSSAAKALTDNKTADGMGKFAPSIGLKLLRSGLPSANLVAM